MWEGYQPVPYPKIDNIDLVYKGKKIPQKLWFEVMGFMVDSFNKFDEETQLNLMFNVKTQEWAIWVFPQFMMGMHTEADTEDPEFNKQRDSFGPDWVVGGTVHHHCKMKAFASSTDNEDEIDKDGVHITLGNMHEDTQSVDVRVTYNGIKHKSRLTEFVDVSDLDYYYTQSGVNPDIIDDLLEAFLCSTYVDTPPEWMENVKKKTISRTHYGTNGIGNGTGTSLPKNKWANWKMKETTTKTKTTKPFRNT